MVSGYSAAKAALRHDSQRGETHYLVADGGEGSFVGYGFVEKFGDVNVETGVGFVGFIRLFRDEVFPVSVSFFDGLQEFEIGGVVGNSEIFRRFEVAVGQSGAFFYSEYVEVRVGAVLAGGAVFVFKRRTQQGGFAHRQLLPNPAQSVCFSDYHQQVFPGGLGFLGAGELFGSPSGDGNKHVRGFS